MNKRLCDPHELLDMMKSGDLDALDLMSRCYGEHMLAVGRRRCRTSEEAEDAVQDAFLSAGEHLTDFRGDGSVEGWLLRMVINACHRMRRGRKNDPYLHEELAPTTAEDRLLPDEAAAQGEFMQALGSALTELPAIDRTLVLLTDGEGWKGPEIAARVGMTPAAVRTRLSRARRRLRQSLQNFGA